MTSLLDSSPLWELALQLAVPLLSFVLGWLVQKLLSIKKGQRALEDGVRALLKHEIMIICLRCELHHTISYSDNEALNSMYLAYVALGGNGAVKEMYAKVHDYPLVTVSYNQKRASKSATGNKA